MTNETKSACCDSAVTVVSGVEEKKSYICKKCNKACEVLTPQTSRMTGKPVRGHITEVDADCSALDLGKEKKFLKLDIACGNNKKEGFTGVDIAEETQCDWICNLNYYPWQYKEIVLRHESGIQHKGLQKIEDSSVGEIFCSHYIEHVKDLRKFAAEIYRILIPGGRVTFVAPYYSSIRAMQDPTHVNFISEATFLYWKKD